MLSDIPNEYLISYYSAPSQLAGKGSRVFQRPPLRGAMPKLPLSATDGETKTRHFVRSGRRFVYRKEMPRRLNHSTSFSGLRLSPIRLHGSSKPLGSSTCPGYWRSWTFPLL